MSQYTVTWKDRDGTSHSQAFEAEAATAAIFQAIDKVELLKNNPNLITRVIKEQ